ncbi:putative N-acetylneuraminic acid synthase-like protein [Shewanella benthica]|uniref:Putative N-acetylneuraminic acid synthase-like protein n=1 Tax=Shewanella benthica TaxID=43661 RepID=A0A330LWH3_9GAMM|nr:glycosyltransferase family 52 [Shewanella benthica]SQH74669.1 putative N-acetylneuraminic acid synthase-like protein [Shewanella benthica]
MNVLERLGVNSDNILVYESTYYSLFLYLLCDDNWQQRDFLIFADRISFDTITRIKKYANVLDETYRFIPRPMPKFLKNPKYYISRKIEQKQLFDGYDFCIGDARQINNWLIDIKRIQIEDGTLTRHELVFGDKKRGLFEYLCLKEPNKVKRIDKFVIAAEIEPHVDFKGKVETIDFFALWRNKSLQDKAEILDIFNVDADLFSGINRDFSVLFTQPFSETTKGYKEADKVDGYRELVTGLGIEEAKLVIKPHPKEVTDYSLHFPLARVLKPSFPSELMPILNVHLDKVVSLSSTAGSCFKGFCNEIIYAKAPEYFKMPKKLRDSINKLEL